MSATARERFLAAVAKMLGENPVGPSPLERVLICKEWLLKEILDSIFPSSEGNFTLDRDKLNRLLVNCERRMVTEHFYQYFFGLADTLEKFEAGIEKFRVKAMWLYGNFQFAFKQLGTSPQGEFGSQIARTEPRLAAEFEAREPFEDIESIPVSDLGLLGYISGKQKIADLEICSELLELLHSAPARIGEILT